MLPYDFLPILSTDSDAASFSHSVLPFYHVATGHVFDYVNLFECYSTTNPLVFGSILSVVSSIAVFCASLYTGNWSWFLTSLEVAELRVDRFWVVMPVVYSGHYLTFASLHGLLSPRLLIISGLQIIWGIRLFYNYWRKGGYERYYLSALFISHTYIEGRKITVGPMFENILARMCPLHWSPL